MPPSTRSNPFSANFYSPGENPGDGDATKQAPGEKKKIIPINSFAPTPIESEHFRGHVLIVHETGNEPGISEDTFGSDGKKAKVPHVELQLQGRFKHAAKVDQNAKGGPGGVWVCGEVDTPLKMGWFTMNLANVVMKFVKMKTGGRFHSCFGNDSELPHLAFPIGDVFTCIRTPSGEDPPKLGSPALSETKFQAGPPVQVDPEFIYTFFYKTPFVDLCSWELLNIPGISPLPMETGLGDIRTIRLLLYDSNVAGTHPNCRKGLLLELNVTRGAKGDVWLEQSEDGSVTAPLDDASDEEDDMAEHLDGIAVDHAIGEEDRDDDSGTASDESLEEDEEDDGLCSHTESEHDAWQAREAVMLDLDRGDEVGMPYYIEAIDRRRRRRQRVWYVFALKNQGQRKEWFHAKEISELKALCWPRMRLRSFRRGAARGCYAAQTLEQFRGMVFGQLFRGTRLQDALLRAAASDAGSDVSDSLHNEPYNTDKKSPAKRNKAPLLPPRFLDSSGSRTCTLAFAHAHEGRSSLIREGLVGVVQFEGRVCEEWLRLSQDGTLRCFAPYDCDKPRLKLSKSQVLRVEAIPGLFLGRFHRWQVHFELRVFVFCSSDIADRNAWVAALEPTVSESAHSAATASSFVRRPTVYWPMSGDSASLLMDVTRTRRWRPKKRLVLNDRLNLFTPNVVESPAELSADLLARMLALPLLPTPEDVIELTDATCHLKSVKFAGCNQDELLAFWINVYHCLLLHGHLLFGASKSRRELANFNSRVSYLVGAMPVSLKEIECLILRTASLDGRDTRTFRMDRVRQAMANAKLLALRCLPVRYGGGSASSSIEPDIVKMTARSCVCSETVKRKQAKACCFLGSAPEVFGLPQPDPRVALCLNRRNMSCLSSIPVLYSARLSEFLDEVSRAFVAEFVQVQLLSSSLPRSFGTEWESLVTKVMLPPCCRAIKREFKLDQPSLLRFLWQFVPPEHGTPSVITTVRFLKYNNLPRQRVDLRRMVVGAEQPPESDAVAADEDIAEGKARTIIAL